MVSDDILGFEEVFRWYKSGKFVRAVELKRGRKELGGSELGKAAGNARLLPQENN